MKAIVLVGICAVLLAGCGQMDQVDRALSQANNTQRTHDASALLNAIGQYELERSVVLVPSGTSEIEVAKNDLDICAVLVPDYLVSLPVDPSFHLQPVQDCEQDYSTGYVISRDASGVLTVRAPRSELGVVIEVRG